MEHETGGTGFTEHPMLGCLDETRVIDIGAWTLGAVLLGQRGQGGEAGSTCGGCEAEGWDSCSPWRSSEANSGWIKPKHIQED